MWGEFNTRELEIPPGICLCFRRPFPTATLSSPSVFSTCQRELSVRCASYHSVGIPEAREIFLSEHVSSYVRLTQSTMWGITCRSCHALAGENAKSA